MRIAFTHNLALSQSEADAEFDTPETVALITESLRSAGHHVEPIEVSGPASRTVARLEALAPDLVFNTAEGARGRFREAFFPALFESLGLPFTGSDAYVCAVTLDKHVTKLLLAEHGVRSPRGVLIEDRAQLPALDLRFPVIAKPNNEGSSMGITADSIVENKKALVARVTELLGRFPAGILCEEFIVGRDVVVPYIEGVSPETGGALEPAAYNYLPKYASTRKYQIYDFDLKVMGFDGLEVKVPADIPRERRDEVLELSRRCVKALGIRDACRFDFRLAEDGTPYFLEVNALPSLEDGASIYLSGALAGLDSHAAVLDAIVRSAAERQGLSVRGLRSQRRRAKLQIGITFNLKSTGPAHPDGDDSEAEYDTPQTIASIREAIESHGHDVVELEATPDLPGLLAAAAPDVVFNVAEGFRGRARESQVPALLDLMEIEYTGSGPTALSLALDKGLAKRLVEGAGVATPRFLLMTTGRERLPRELPFPLLVKPVAEGSSKGLGSTSVVQDEAELREVAGGLIRKYRQAVIAEEFLPGREFTVALLGEKRPVVLPALEVVFTDPEEPYPIYGYERKLTSKNMALQAPAMLDSALRREVERTAKAVFTVLGCRDLARVDLRLDGAGRVHFIECNPLPGLVPEWSDMCLIATASGRDYRTLIGEILAPALRRRRERLRERRLEGRL